MNTLEYVPVPAFEDNYIWVVSDGQRRRRRRSGRRRARGSLSGKTRVAADRYFTHAPSSRPRRRRGRSARHGRRPIPVYGPAGEAIEHLTQRLKDGDRVTHREPGARLHRDRRARVTRAGHIAYFQPADPTGTPHLFCGDTLFASGCGRLFEGTPQQMLASLDALAALPEQHAGSLRSRIHAVEHPFRARLRAGERRARALAGRGAQAMRARHEPTLPTTIAPRKAQ